MTEADFEGALTAAVGQAIEDFRARAPPKLAAYFGQRSVVVLLLRELVSSSSVFSVGSGTVAVAETARTIGLEDVAVRDLLLRRLTRVESRLYRYFLKHPGRIVSQRELIESVFGGAHLDDTSLVRVHVAHLRRKLGKAAAPLRTIRGIGYCWSVVRGVATHRAAPEPTLP